MSEKVVRKEISARVYKLREELSVLDNLLEHGTASDLALAKSQLHGILSSTLDEIEKLLVPQIRARALKTLKKEDGSLVFTSDVWQDVMARLTVEEIMQKYEIKSLATFYKHIRASKELEGENLKKAKKDHEYAKEVLRRLKKSKELF